MTNEEVEFSMLKIGGAAARIKLLPACVFFFVLISRLSRDVEETLTTTNAIVISMLKISFQG